MEPPSAAREAGNGRLLELAAQLERDEHFAEVLASLQAGHGGTLGGVWGSSCALVAAALVRTCPGPLVVVSPHAADVDRLADDLALFTATLLARFPAWETDSRERVVHDEIYGQRLRVLKGLAEAGKGTGTLAAIEGSGGVGGIAGASPLVIVTSIQSLLQPVPSRDTLAASTREIAVGSTCDEQELARWLVERGCHSTSAVELPGEFSVRGGIVDIFPPDALDPVRIELFGDEVESIRRFDVATQRSLATLHAVPITMLQPNERDRAHFTAYLPEGTWFQIIEPQELAEEGKFYLERLERPQEFHSVRTTLAEIYKFSSVTAAGVPAGSMETTAHLGFESVERFSGDIHKVRDELETVSGADEVVIVCDTPAEAQRLGELFADTPLARDGRLHFAQGRLNEGFRIVKQGVVLISAAELFHRQSLARTTLRHAARAIDSFLDLREGDLVVHLSHGIGRYRGLRLFEKDGRKEEHLEIEYHGGTKIYVPSSKIELVQKYVGGTKAKPTLAHIGGKAWVRQKEAAKKAVTDLAAEMLELQARRAARPGIRFPADTAWQQEFDASFPYQETPDQISAIEAIKSDMQDTKPMDRLLCGDVGFGKTEVAIRAAFKAVDAGYQVAVLVPTTVLAEQHGRTFTARMSEFPFEIASLSRFCTGKEQNQIVARTAAGSVDIVIGTHRLASPDVNFANLGLLIIDEEQRFGVEIKERLKAIRSTVDVLTMTATPIPRTLHMALLGVRNISNLETPPPDRLAVETRVTRFDAELIRHAILRELNRDGQIYFVHNRVQSIEGVAERLREIVPEARIEVGHGQMPEGHLEEVMFRFVRHEFDILLATTIIESGLDIPNANTMFIHDADRYGLADLHQLRGRVGRYKHRAYCYLLIDQDKHLSPEAARRLRAIEEFSHMGAGFALAMRDLELRGAGNLLGTQQSGHIASVGYEMYCAMLEKAARELQKLPPREVIDVNIDLPAEGFLPPNYVPDQRLKIDLYRRLARLTTVAEVDEFSAELEDRFGSRPTVVEQLLELARLRIWAHGWGITTVRREDNYLVFAYTDRAKLANLVKRVHGQLRIADAVSAYLPVPPTVSTAGEVLAIVKSLLQPASTAA